MSKSSPAPYVHGPLPKYTSCMHQADIYRKRTNFQALMRTIKATCSQMGLLTENILHMFFYKLSTNVKMELKVISLMEDYLFYLLSFGSYGQGTALLKVLWWRRPLGFGFLRSQTTWRLFFVSLRRLVLLLKAQQTWVRRRDKDERDASTKSSNLVLLSRNLSTVRISAVLIP